LEVRKKVLMGILRDLHRGVEMPVLQKRFAELVKDIGPSEISEIEQSLIDEGMPEEEVKRLCDVHVGVFKESLDKQEGITAEPGHPIHTFMLENVQAQNLLIGLEEVLGRIGTPPDESKFESEREKLSGLIEKLSEIDKHYLRKENQLFPALEDHDVSGPSQVMWAIHDDIRSKIKEVKELLTRGDPQATRSIEELIQPIRDMVYKEEHILLPMALETLTPADWARVWRGEGEIGYAWVSPGKGWEPGEEKETEKAGEPHDLDLRTGKLSPEEIDLMLTHLPLDVSFVDVDDKVSYYTDSKERIFPRSPGVIGRSVQKCHPPKSVGIVNKILDEFKAGTKDVAEFWIQRDGRFIHIRYLAIRDEKGKYRGTMEVAQDVTGIRALEGQRTLLNWD
jgi:DUF438 domain-containing protein